MTPSWPMFLAECKSGWSAIAGSCFLGRAAAQHKCSELQQQLLTARDEVARRQTEIERLQNAERQAQQRIAELTAELARPRTLPLGEKPPGMQTGAGLIALCVNLARTLGLRATVRALRIFFPWLGVEVEIPVYQTIRLWMQRLGLARQQRAECVEGGVWLVDHTNQISQEKVLVVLRVPEARARQEGPLRQEEVEVLAMTPGESWKRDDVLQVYRATAQQCGVPRAILSDGAVELQEPIGILREMLPKTAEKQRLNPLAIRDVKHFLANQLAALLLRDPDWQAFTRQLGSTRAAVQQTELAHFTPPAIKVKARFMNLAATLRWAQTVLWHVDRPDSQSRRGITAQRLEEKLGWLRAFAPPLRQWQACQEVITTALAFLNTRGLFQGATAELRQLATKFAAHPLCESLLESLLQFVQGYEDQLACGERLPMSTEILESCFGQYKHLEQQHSKGGFTSLLLCLPVLLRPTTAAEITASMQQVQTKEVRAWQQAHLPSTLTSRRQLVYREARPPRPRQQQSATRITAIK